MSKSHKNALFSVFQKERIAKILKVELEGPRKKKIYLKEIASFLGQCLKIFKLEEKLQDLKIEINFNITDQEILEIAKKHDKWEEKFEDIIKRTEPPACSTTLGFLRDDNVSLFELYKSHRYLEDKDSNRKEEEIAKQEIKRKEEIYLEEFTELRTLKHRILNLSTRTKDLEGETDVLIKKHYQEESLKRYSDNLSNKAHNSNSLVIHNNLNEVSQASRIMAFNPYVQPVKKTPANIPELNFEMADTNLLISIVNSIFNPNFAKTKLDTLVPQDDPSTKDSSTKDSITNDSITKDSLIQ